VRIGERESYSVSRELVSESLACQPLAGGAMEESDNLENDPSEENKIPKTHLGDAVEGLITTWNQLVSHIVADVGQVQPTIDHVKESAEYSVRQFKDACLEAGREFTRVALEWRLSHPDETLHEVVTSIIGRSI
jgi:hypothetical protein